MQLIYKATQIYNSQNKKQVPTIITHKNNLLMIKPNKFIRIN
jgi:hypothetical protein